MNENYTKNNQYTLEEVMDECPDETPPVGIEDECK